MRHRTVRGEILYTSKKPAMLGKKRGYERFAFTHHVDGKTTLSAHCEIAEPAPGVMRDILYSIDERGTPMDCHVRLTVGDAFMGSGWFRFTDTMLECESYGPSIGRVSQRVPLDGPLIGFGTHPVVADAFMLHRQGEWKPGEKRRMPVYVPSPDHRGATPPFAAFTALYGHYVGEETISVKAGTFQTRHFQWLDDGSGGMAGEHPPFDVWASIEHGVMVQGGVGGYMQTWYELVQLEEETPDYLA
jgi:hypothetical protein